MINVTNRPALVSDLANYARTTVGNQSGITGMALKGGLSAATKAKPEIVETAVEQGLDDVLAVLTPYWDNKPEGVSFSSHLEPVRTQVADDILAVADHLSEKHGNPALNKLYSSVRGKAAKVLADAIPGLGEIVEKNAG